MNCRCAQSRSLSPTQPLVSAKNSLLPLPDAVAALSTALKALTDLGSSLTGLPDAVQVRQPGAVSHLRHEQGVHQQRLACLFGFKVCLTATCDIEGCGSRRRRNHLVWSNSHPSVIRSTWLYSHLQPLLAAKDALLQLPANLTALAATVKPLTDLSSQLTTLPAAVQVRVWHQLDAAWIFTKVQWCAESSWGQLISLRRRWLALMQA